MTNNAALVPEAQTNNSAANLKPISDLQTRTADAKGSHLRGRHRGDHAGAQRRRRHGVAHRRHPHAEPARRDRAHRAQGDDALGEPNGILNTTGVLQQAFATDMVTSIRKGKTLLRETSNTIPQAVLLNPEDDEAFDLLKDGNDRYLGNGPFGTGPSTAWAVPRIASAAMPKGQAPHGRLPRVPAADLRGSVDPRVQPAQRTTRSGTSSTSVPSSALQMFRQRQKLAVIDIEAGV
ncbi:phage major capsid protein [Microbacterium oxydans]|nr:phage major capsid protein [Microbacterium oxydans]